MQGLIIELVIVGFIFWLLANLVHFFINSEDAGSGFFFLSNKLLKRKDKKDESQGTK